MQSVDPGVLAALLLVFGVKVINDRKDKTVQAYQKESVCNHDCNVDYLHYSDYTDYFFVIILIILLIILIIRIILQ